MWAVVLVSIAAAIFVLARATAPRRLIRAAGEAPQRPIEGRLAGFPWAPRFANARSEPSLTALRSAAESVLSDESVKPRDAAVAALLYGRTAIAVERLESLTSRGDASDNDWSDLAAAMLEKARATNDPESSSHALVAADRALAINPFSPQARYNRAIALEQLGLTAAAAKAWRHYLELDGSSDWAREARERLAAASAPTRAHRWKSAQGDVERASERGDLAALGTIARAFPLQVRTLVETDLLPQWGVAVMDGDAPRAERLRARARNLATALQETNGDALLATSLQSAADPRLLAAAWVAYGEARALNSNRRIAQSLERFIEAERKFAAARNPMELSAAYFHANALVDLHRPAESSEMAAAIKPRVLPQYQSLWAHLEWLRNRLANDAGRYYDAYSAAKLARESFEKLGELDYAARLRTSEAAMLWRMGRDAEAWQERREALAGSFASGRPRWIETAMEPIARDEAENGNRDVALSLFKVQLEAKSELPGMRFAGVLWRDFLEASLRDKPLDPAEARAIANAIPDTTQRADALDELRLAEAMALMNSDAQRAEQLLTEVAEFRTRTQFEARLPAIYLQRGRARRALLRTQEAESDFRRAIELIELRRVRIGDESLRDAYLGNSTDAYRELAELMLSRRDWQGAFVTSERARARLLLDRASIDVMPPQAIADTVPPNEVAVHLTCLDRETLLVTIEHGRATPRIVRAGAREIASLRDEAQKQDERALRRLYELLIAPLQDRLAANTVLVIVPDDATIGIPFAALRDGGGRYLIERVSIAIAPAAAAIANQQTLARDATGTIIADPAFSTSLFPSLDRLPAARADVRAVRSVFRNAITLTGNEATPAAFQNAAKSSELLHVAAHAFSSRRDASVSLIALAPGPGDDGTLYLRDIESLDLPHHPLVVLAGCQTAAFGGGKGSIRTLADAFLAAGSGAVLATLWDIDDQHASALTNTFYRNVAHGVLFPAALREAQLAALRTMPERDWSAFQISLGIPPHTGRRVD
jgi:CHAT domain-containing protein